MQNHYQHNHCHVCEKLFDLGELRTLHENKMYCQFCYEAAHVMSRKLGSDDVSVVPMFKKVELKEPSHYNEPEHYHNHAIDTIEFLQKGFPPEVFLHFALANVIKYAQRAEYKNGLEDLDKLVDYAVRARDWYKRRWTK